MRKSALGIGLVGYSEQTGDNFKIFFLRCRQKAPYFFCDLRRPANCTTAMISRRQEIVERNTNRAPDRATMVGHTL